MVYSHEGKAIVAGAVGNTTLSRVAFKMFGLFNIKHRQLYVVHTRRDAANKKLDLGDVG